MDIGNGEPWGAVRIFGEPWGTADDDLHFSTLSGSSCEAEDVFHFELGLLSSAR